MSTIVNLCDGSDLSLNDIKRMQNNNTSVLRSGHIGNLDCQTLFLANNGFFIVLDEYAVGSMRVYRPAYIIKDGRENMISSCDNLPATHLMFDNNRSMASYHYKLLNNYYPNSIKLTSEYLLNNEDRVYKAITILSKERIQSFAKLIDVDGIIYKHYSFNENSVIFKDDLGKIKDIKITELADIYMNGLRCTKNSIIDNKIEMFPILVLDVDSDVSLLTLCDINWNENIDSVKAVHFSGLEMINYMVKNEKEAKNHFNAINEIFNLLLPIWTNNAPSKIDIMIVPTNILPYFICDSNEDLRKINQYYSLYLEMSKLSMKKDELWKKNIDSTWNYINTLDENELLDIIYNIDNESVPNSFLNSLKKVRTQLYNYVKIDIQELKKIVFNYLLYKNLETVGITRVMDCIKKEEEKMRLLNNVNLSSFTQYDLADSKILFPDFAYDMSVNDLMNLKKVVKKYDNKY